MNKERKDIKRGVINLILNVIIIVMSFLFLLTAGVMAESFYDAYRQPYDEDNFYYYVENERYYYLINARYRNVINGFEGDEETKEYYGLAKYYEAATLYRAYDVYGNREMAEKFLKKMKQAEDDMGGWSIAKNPIHKQLGIE